MSIKMKPCPLCGSDNVTIEKVSVHHGMDGSYSNWLIGCNNRMMVNYTLAADAFYGRSYLKTEDDAIDYWNKECEKYSKHDRELEDQDGSDT